MSTTASAEGTSTPRAAPAAASRPPLDRVIDAPCAWRGDAVQPASGRIPVSPAVLDELRQVARQIAQHDGRIEDFGVTSFAMPETTRLMARVRDAIDDGVGFAILERLPVEEWDERTSKAIVWLITSHIGAIVEQKLNGTRLYDVRDTGVSVAHGVRRSITNLEQEFHTDGPWLTLTPEVIALACLRQAGTGGMSRLASLATVHNEMRARYPDLLPALYQPLWWDRQAEHPPDDAQCSRHPVFAKEGQHIIARYYDDYIRNGHGIMKAPLDAETQDALAAMRSIVEDPACSIEFRLEAGQIAYVNNHRIAHARTAFTDATAGAGRHLLRLWMRRTGTIDLESSAPPAA